MLEARQGEGTAVSKMPSGSASVINVTPDELPERCRDCRFFDHGPLYRFGELYEGCLPMFDYEDGEWRNWKGHCRRHPPTAKGTLPTVDGMDIACGDGIGGRKVWEIKARQEFDEEKERREREESRKRARELAYMRERERAERERRAQDMEATRDMRLNLRPVVGSDAEATAIAMALAGNGTYTLDAAKSLGYVGLIEIRGIGDSRAKAVLEAADRVSHRGCMAVEALDV